MQTVHILVGPKGSGKTHIGGVLEEEFQTPFLRVEPLLIEHRRKHGGPSGDLPRHGFDVEEQAIHAILTKAKSVIIEATGSSEFFPSFIANLASLYQVNLVRVACPLDLCFERVKQRSIEGHFPMTDEDIRAINRLAVAQSFNWDMAFDNSGPASRHKIVADFRDLLCS